MLDRIKNWLGIEGVKLSLDLPDSTRADAHSLIGILNLTTLKEQRIEGISFSLIETYTRGRGDAKRIDDTILAQEHRIVNLHLKDKSTFAYPFELPFVYYQSNIERISRKIILRPFTSAMKLIHGAKSVYHLNVSLQVKGNKLQPHIQKRVWFR